MFSRTSASGAQVPAPLQSDNLTGHPIFAALYDRLLASSEEGGLRAMRAELLGDAMGRTLELGAGTGHNLPHYTDSVTELVLTEPDPHMASRLHDHLAAEPPAPAEVCVVDVGAEELPFDDEAFDTMVATLVLCTVDDPARAAAEIRRVLRPDGRLLYLEHVRSSDGGRLARWQDRVERPWEWIAGGCHPNRPTEATLAGAGLEFETLSRETFPRASWTPWMKPVIRGTARPAAA